MTTVNIKISLPPTERLRDSNRRSGQGRDDFTFYSIIDGVPGTRSATQLVNVLSSTSFNSAPTLDRHSEEATTGDEEDDVEDGEENKGGSGIPPVGSGSSSHSGGGGSGSPSGESMLNYYSCSAEYVIESSILARHPHVLDTASSTSSAEDKQDLLELQEVLPHRLFSS